MLEKSKTTFNALLRSRTAKILVLVIIILTAYLLTAGFLEKNRIQIDLTQNNINTPSDRTIEIIKHLDFAIRMTGFIREADINERKRLIRFARNISRHHKNFDLVLIDPAKEIELSRSLGVSDSKRIMLEYQDQKTFLGNLTEQGFVNALIRISKKQMFTLAFLEGHNERSPFGNSELDYRLLAEELKSQGFHIKSVSLMDIQQGKQDFDVLVIADPQKQFPPLEVELIESYVRNGGNMVWLTEPGNQIIPEILPELFEIELLPGFVVDGQAQMRGLADPRFTLINEYPYHLITADLSLLTLFPTVRALEVSEGGEWETEVFLETPLSAWSKTDEAGADLEFETGQDIKGPLAFGLALSQSRDGLDEMDFVDRDETLQDDLFLDKEETAEDPATDGVGSRIDEKPRQQRIVIIGDSDFMSDFYLGYVGNLNLASNIFNWITGENVMIELPARTVVDQQLLLTDSRFKFLYILIVVILPSAIFIPGLVIWKRRRNL